MIGGVATTCARAMGSEAPWVADRELDTSKARTEARPKGPLVRRVTAQQFALLETNEQPSASRSAHERPHPSRVPPNHRCHRTRHGVDAPPRHIAEPDTSARPR